MEAKDIDLIVDYTRKFIDAVTPVAKQAYEIGLLTLRIDAAQLIAGSVIALIAVAICLRFLFADYRRAKVKAELPENAKDMWKMDPSFHLMGGGVPHVLGAIISFFVILFSVANLLSLWLWAKLFAPELWLAHIAVEKLLK